ncbi:hypothetical protein Dda_3316 [Drechslerella dactyloides]|uniref:Uncharacterized protein n=1 Tax=Drechslerella dactyloides TaxID=74499 RepID=A0AAD6J1R0_DREDA|nr:hypothetical protein Dda_3316 [Drechslerella dactyloides]
MGASIPGGGVSASFARYGGGGSRMLSSSLQRLRAAVVRDTLRRGEAGSSKFPDSIYTNLCLGMMMKTLHRNAITAITGTMTASEIPIFRPTSCGERPLAAPSVCCANAIEVDADALEASISLLAIIKLGTATTRGRAEGVTSAMGIDEPVDTQRTMLGRVVDIVKGLRLYREYTIVFMGKRVVEYSNQS